MNETEEDKQPREDGLRNYLSWAGGRKAFLLLLQAPLWEVTMKPGPSSARYLIDSQGLS